MYDLSQCFKMVLVLSLTLLSDSVCLRSCNREFVLQLLNLIPHQLCSLNLIEVGSFSKLSVHLHHLVFKSLTAVL